MNNKIINSIITIMVISIVSIGIFFSCEEKEYDYNNNMLTEKLKPINNPYYSSNPYNNAGYQHNILLEKVKEKLLDIYGTTDLSREIIYNAYISVLMNEGLFASEEDAIQSIPFDLLNDILEDKEEFYSNIINNTDLSLYAKELMNDLFSNIFELAERSEEYSDYKNLIIETEDVILSSTLPNKEKQILLQSTSIARYSIYYWFRYFEMEKEAKEKRPTWKWLVVAGADLAGALAGKSATTAIGASSLATTLVGWNDKPETPPAPDTNTVSN